MFQIMYFVGAMLWWRRCRSIYVENHLSNWLQSAINIQIIIITMLKNLDKLQMIKQRIFGCTLQWKHNAHFCMKNILSESSDIIQIYCVDYGRNTNLVLVYLWRHYLYSAGPWIVTLLWYFRSFGKIKKYIIQNHIWEKLVIGMWYGTNLLSNAMY